MIKRNERLKIRTHRIEWVQPQAVKSNEASPAFHKAFYESISADPTISPHILARHRKIAQSKAISTGMKGGLNQDQIKNEAL
jgi:hypothetical protein